MTRARESQEFNIGIVTGIAAFLALLAMTPGAASAEARAMTSPIASPIASQIASRMPSPTATTQLSGTLQGAIAPPRQQPPSNFQQPASSAEPQRFPFTETNGWDLPRGWHFGKATSRGSRLGLVWQNPDTQLSLSTFQLSTKGLRFVHRF